MILASLFRLSNHHYSIVIPEHQNKSQVNYTVKLLAAFVYNAMASYVALEALFNFIVFCHCTLFRYLIASKSQMCRDSNISKQNYDLRDLIFVLLSQHI